MSKGKIKVLFSTILLIIISISIMVVDAKYIPNNRDTLTDPSPMIFEEVEFTDDYSLLAEKGDLEFYYRKSTDCFVIKDKRNGYSWKTGIDQLTAKQMLKAYENALLDALLMAELESSDGKLDPDTEAAITKEMQEKYLLPASTMTDTYIYRANSTITVEYIDSANNTKRVSSNNSKVQTKYSKDKTTKNTYLFTYDFTKVIDLVVEVLITFSSKGINVQILDEKITGEAQKQLSAIEIFPFLGAMGGEFTPFDFDEPMWEYDNIDLTYKQQLIDGYSVIPDGSGALVRFKANTQEFTTIDLPVYGDNAGVATRQYFSSTSYRDGQNASLPMFGMVHGYNQNAFLAYADNGDRYMHILSVPYGLSNVFYNWTYAKFFYNQLYFQVYNDAGQGNYKLMSERNHFDISMNYEFLCGDGKNDNLSADYIGIANAYKNVIKESLTLNEKKYNDVPIRIDFIMSDSEPAIIGYNDVVMTKASDVRNILKDLNSIGITNINSGLYGYDDGGITLHKLDRLKFNNSIGSKNDYKELISEFNQIGIDLSFVDDYYFINNEVYNLSGKAVKHYNGQYCIYYNPIAGNENIDVSNYLRSELAVKYSDKKLNKIIKQTNPSSYTINGVSDRFVSHHKNSLDECIDDYITLYQNASEKVSINALRPNSYLWPYIDRYLNAKAFNSQYTIETDSIPLISFILNDYMEIYAEYSNFSFYDTESILRMIDYNLLPSFILTKESSHLLINTNSNEYFSTEYDIYKDTISSVYNGVNSKLKEVYNDSWIDRDVLVNGIVKNTYSSGKEVIINYTDEVYVYNGHTINPLSCEVIG